MPFNDNERTTGSKKESAHQRERPRKVGCGCFWLLLAEQESFAERPRHDNKVKKNKGERWHGFLSGVKRLRPLARLARRGSFILITTPNIIAQASLASDRGQGRNRGGLGGKVLHDSLPISVTASPLWYDYVYYSRNCYYRCCTPH